MKAHTIHKKFEDGIWGKMMGKKKKKKYFWITNEGICYRAEWTAECFLELLWLSNVNWIDFCSSTEFSYVTVLWKIRWQIWEKCEKNTHFFFLIQFEASRKFLSMLKFSVVFLKPARECRTKGEWERYQVVKKNWTIKLLSYDCLQFEL